MLIASQYCDYRNVESELEHSASLSGAITALRYDEQQRIAEVADKVKQDEEVI